MTSRTRRRTVRLRQDQWVWALVLALAVGVVRSRRRAARRDAELQELRAALATQRRTGAAVAAELRQEARTDPLTGLSNRRRWLEQLEQELERARRTGSRLAVAVVDVDHFKQVNDTQGHAAGDDLLRAVGAAFAHSVRSIDVVARVGGEEFAIALPAASAEDAARIVERVRTSGPPGTTCSAGMVVWDGRESLHELQHRADLAMYAAKSGGRDRLVVA